MSGVDPARSALDQNVSRRGHDVHEIVERLFAELHEQVDLLRTIGVLREVLALRPDDPPVRLEDAARAWLLGCTEQDPEPDG